MSLTQDEGTLMAITSRLLGASEPPSAESCSPALAELLRRHHLRPLAHAHGVNGLATASQQCAVIAAFHRRTLSELGEALAHANIPWTVIKGAAYAWRLYEAPELRPMSDLDVLVHAEDFERACKVLQSTGFSERTVSRRTRHAQTFTRASHEVIDLHRSILQPIRGNSGMEDAWQRARPSPTHAGFWQLDIVDLCWIHLAHMARHEFVVPLVSYVDWKRLTNELVAAETERLDSALRRLRLDFARDVANTIAHGLFTQTRNTSSSQREHLVVPSLEELARGRHRNRLTQITRKLALFPRDGAVMGIAWALRALEDQFIRTRER